MESNALRQKYAEYLQSLGIHNLRALGRKLGVERPAAKKKGDLVDDIIKIILKEAEPIPRSVRGAPVKDEYVDPSILDRLNHIAEESEPEFSDFVLHSNAYSDEFVISGTLTLNSLSSATIRSDITKANYEEDCPVTKEEISAFSLREGDYVTAYAKKDGGINRLVRVLSVNGKSLGEYEGRLHFSDLEVTEPSNPIYFGDDSFAFSLFRGERILVSEGKGGKSDIELFTSVLRNIAARNPSLSVFAVALDVKKEEIAILKDNPSLFVTAFSFGVGAEEKAHAVKLVLEKAKRFTECGRDALVAVNSLSALLRAFDGAEENADSPFTEYYSRYAIESALSLFDTAENAYMAGSLTSMIFVKENAWREGDKIAVKEFMGKENCLLRYNFCDKYVLDEENSHDSNKKY